MHKLAVICIKSIYARSYQTDTNSTYPENWSLKSQISHMSNMLTFTSAKQSLLYFNNWAARVHHYTASVDVARTSANKSRVLRIRGHQSSKPWCLNSKKHGTPASGNAIMRMELHYNWCWWVEQRECWLWTASGICTPMSQTNTVPADKSDCQADYWLRISTMKHKQIVLEDEQWPSLLVLVESVVPLLGVPKVFDFRGPVN